MKTIKLNKLQIDYVLSVIKDTFYYDAFKIIKPDVDFSMTPDMFYEINDLLGRNEAFLVMAVDAAKTIKDKDEAQQFLDFATNTFNIFQGIIVQGIINSETKQ